MRYLVEDWLVWKIHRKQSSGKMSSRPFDCKWWIEESHSADRVHPGKFPERGLTLDVKNKNHSVVYAAVVSLIHTVMTVPSGCHHGHQNYTPGRKCLGNINRRLGERCKGLWCKLASSKERLCYNSKRSRMADWLKPRQHICVALATVCWTGADHWIQMWKSFGVPISDFMNPFFPLLNSWTRIQWNSFGEIQLTGPALNSSGIRSKLWGW